MDERHDALDLYWVPLGAGTPVVAFCGRMYERLHARLRRHPRCDLYHCALVARVGGEPIAIEMAPTPDGDGAARRGVVASGPVGLRWLGRWRLFRYEVRCWPGGDIPDLAHAVGEPVRVSDDPARISAALYALGQVPTHVWGRDAIGVGDMWNSNSVVAWSLVLAGLDEAAGSPPPGGRAPGWQAGVVAAERHRHQRVSSTSMAAAARAADEPSP